MFTLGSKDHQHVELCQHCQIMQGFPKLAKSYGHFSSKKLHTMADTKSTLYGEQWPKMATQSRN